VPSAPYIEDSQVFLVTVETKTQDEIAAETAAAIVSTNMQNKASRAAAYVLEADPLFFKSQRGEATNQEWLDKVAEIKAKFPTIGA
jgi:hypothetical protein